MSSTTVQPSPWKTGDFHIIGREQTIVGEYLCEDSDLGAGHTVLDVACGSGNTALAAARRRNTVSGIDLAANLIERAKLRAAAEGFEIDFRTGTADELPYPDASFDFVLSTFGVMFAPDQQRAADEMLRVCKPGGIIAMANWVPESLPGAMFRESMKYMPSPPPGPPPIEWGMPAGLNRLFGSRVRRARLFDRCVRTRFVSFDAWFQEFTTYFGPVSMLYGALDESKRKTFEEEMRTIVMRYNRATDGTLSAAMSYVNVVMEKGGSG